MAKKCLRVLLAFEFYGIDDADSPDADEITAGLTEATKQLRKEYGANVAWVDDAFIVDGDE